MSRDFDDNISDFAYWVLERDPNLYKEYLRERL
jgi:hypothetical protein